MLKSKLIRMEFFCSIYYTIYELGIYKCLHLKILKS